MDSKKNPQESDPKLPHKDRTGNVPSDAAAKVGNVPNVDANEEEGSSAGRPGNGSMLRNSRTDESGARLD
jgi:hypothetical protein